MNHWLLWVLAMLGIVAAITFWVLWRETHAEQVEKTGEVHGGSGALAEVRQESWNSKQGS